MRRLKMVVLCLVAAFALSALAAGPASATTNVWTKFQQCPFHFPSTGPGFGETQGCIYGEAGKESFFQAGKVTVKFEKKIILQGGFQENEITGEQHFLPALNRATVSQKAEPAPSLTEGIDPEVLEEPEKKRYEEYLASGGSTKVTATIVLVPPPQPGDGPAHRHPVGRGQPAC
jgi:hypothetical protein